LSRGGAAAIGVDPAAAAGGATPLAAFPMQVGAFLVMGRERNIATDGHAGPALVVHAAVVLLGRPEQPLGELGETGGAQPRAAAGVECGGGLAPAVGASVVSKSASMVISPRPSASSKSASIRLAAA